MAISQIYGLLWELIFGRWGLGRSISIPNGNFSDSCSDCSYFFPTWELKIWQTSSWTSPLQMAISQIPALLWGVIFGRSSVGRSTLPLNMAISQILALTVHILFFLWELNIWQTMAWHIYPSFKWQFHRFLLCSESSYLADQMLADLSILPNGNFTDSCSDYSYFISYSESSTFGRPGLGRSTPPSNGSFTHSCSILRVHIWQTKCWQIYPLSNGYLSDCCSDCSYFFPTLRAHI